MDEEFQKFPRSVEAVLVSQSSQWNPDKVIQWKSTNEVKSQVVKANRKIRDGDFTVSAALVKQALPCQEQIKSFITHLKAVSQNWKLQINEVTLTTNGLLSIKLHRPVVFQKVLMEVFHQGDNYGCQKVQEDKSNVEVLINNAAIAMSLPGANLLDDCGLNQLRCVLFCEQLKSVLQRLGFTVHEVCHHYSSGLLKAFKTFHIQQPSLPVNQEKRTQTTAKFIQRASCSKFRVANETGKEISQNSSKMEARTSPKTGKSSDRTEELLMNCVTLDLKQYLSDSGMEQGKGKYDKNVDLSKVTDEHGVSTSIINECVSLEESSQDLVSKTGVKVMHIAPKTKEFHQQLVDLTWRIVSDTNTSSQVHAICGPVLTRVSSAGNKNMTVEEFYRIREAQTREASVMKYGKEVQGDHWNEVINNLTIAGIKFELLGMQLNNQMKLDVSDTKQNSSWPDSRDGVFVMYNYARLATLFSNYDQEVKNGVYPPLPDLNSIDFTTLREDHEWGLIFNYVMQYPIILQDVYQEVMSNKGPKVNLQMHKICGFLVSLSRDLSSYYSHVHILGGGHTHLLPVMFARLYLMKAIQQVIRNGLTLLSIRPLQQM